MISAGQDGMTLVDTDSPAEVIGLIDLTNPAQPSALGTIEHDGGPTSVTIVSDTIYVAINNSKSLKKPSDYLAAFELSNKKLIAQCDLGGHPDSIAADYDGIFIAVAIENERDEDFNDGKIPQLPAGNITTFNINNPINCNSRHVFDLKGLAEIAPSDPELECLDINREGDYTGGSRDWTVYNKDGCIVGVYKMQANASPTLHQLVPSGIAPVCIISIPQRN